MSLVSIVRKVRKNDKEKDSPICPVDDYGVQLGLGLFEDLVGHAAAGIVTAAV